MTTMRGTTCVPALAVLMSSLVLAACGPGPAPAEEASASLAGDAATIPSGSTAAASARTAAVVPGRDAPVPARTARASDVAPGGVCPSAADEPAPIDGGREVTQGPEPAATVQDAAPAPVQPESPRNPG